jgi:hypothetical protein
MARTIYQARVAELKQRIVKSKEPAFQLLYDNMLEFLGLRMLSRINRSWAQARINEFRDRFPEEKERCDFLDAKVEKAKEKLERRREQREEEKRLPAKTKRGSKSQTEPVAPTPVPGGTTPWDF